MALDRPARRSAAKAPVASTSDEEEDGEEEEEEEEVSSGEEVVLSGSRRRKAKDGEDDNEGAVKTKSGGTIKMKTRKEGEKRNGNGKPKAKQDTRKVTNGKRSSSQHQQRQSPLPRKLYSWEDPVLDEMEKQFIASSSPSRLSLNRVERGRDGLVNGGKSLDSDLDSDRDDSNDDDDKSSDLTEQESQEPILSQSSKTTKRPTSTNTSQPPTRKRIKRTKSKTCSSPILNPIEESDDDGGLITDMDVLFAPLPSQGSSRRSGGGRNGKGKGREEMDMSEDMREEEEEEEEVIERVGQMDPSLRIGNIVLTILKQNGEYYWPAVIKAFHPGPYVGKGKNRKKKEDLYELDVVESGRKKRKREEFYSKHDEEFPVCKLGTFLTTRKRGYIPEPRDATHRALTPDDYAESPHLTEKPFEDLTYREQLFLIRPHLSKIITESRQISERSRKMIATFYSKLDESGFPEYLETGDIHMNNIKELIQPELKRWALRGEWRDGGNVVGEVARPVGSGKYERLDGRQREKFVNEVLLREAIRECCSMTLELGQLDLEELRTMLKDTKKRRLEALNEDRALTSEELAIIQQMDVLDLKDQIVDDELNELYNKKIVEDSGEIIAQALEERNSQRLQMDLRPDGGSYEPEEKPDVFVKNSGRAIMGRQARPKKSLKE